MDSSRLSFQEIEIHHFDGFAGLQKITRADSAFFDGKQWTLEGVSIIEIGKSEVIPLELNELRGFQGSNLSCSNRL